MFQTVIEYLTPSKGKLYHHKMKIQNLAEHSDTEEILDYLKNKNFLYFANGKIKDDQIRNLIDKLKVRLSQNSTAGQKENILTSKQNHNNKTNNKQPQQQKGKIGQFDEIDDFEDELNITPLKHGSASSAKKQQQQDLGWGDKNHQDADFDYENFNLNKLNDEDLKKHKDKMNKLFQLNQKKPGDPDFVYDKRQDFKPYRNCEWDEDAYEEDK